MREAGATVTFSLIWIATTGTGVTGTSAIGAAPGDTLTLQVRLTTDEPVFGTLISLDFDTDLADELNVIGGGEWAGTTYGTTAMTTHYAPLTFGIGDGQVALVESTSSVPGQVIAIESAVTLPGAIQPLPLGTYGIGTARFVVNGPVTDGADVSSRFWSPPNDGVIGADFNPVPPSRIVFGTASVNIPEPATGALLASALLGLAHWRRRRARR